MATPKGKTKDGFETQFGRHEPKVSWPILLINYIAGTNHIGHFYLFQLLKSTLLASATPESPSRVVSLASFGHRLGPVRFHDYNFDEADSYNPWTAYGQAKTANIYFANELERRYGSRNLHSTSVHPGGIWTGLQSHLGRDQFEMTETTKRYMKSPEQGAATTIYAALSAEWKDKGGRYLSNCVEEKPFAHSGEPMFTGDDGYETWAYNEENEKKLWVDSLKMVGLGDDQ